jgi:hypothetical protein
VMQPRHIEMGEFYNQDGLRITATAVDHSPVEPVVAYRFDYLVRVQNTGILLMMMHDCVAQCGQNCIGCSRKSRYFCKQRPF